MDFTHNRPRPVLLDTHPPSPPASGGEPQCPRVCWRLFCRPDAPGSRLNSRPKGLRRRDGEDVGGALLLLEDPTKQGGQREGVEIMLGPFILVFNYRQLLTPPRPLPHRHARRET